MIVYITYNNILDFLLLHYFIYLHHYFNQHHIIRSENITKYETKKLMKKNIILIIYFDNRHIRQLNGI